MSLIINTNVASLNAQRNLNASKDALATSLQRLSSGLRINSARDDAAGMAISERMTSQINGLNQAARNANDGVSLAQTAEGALQQSSDILQRIRELSIQSANSSNSTTDRASLNSEVNQLISELDRIANSTSFNGLKLLDGTYQGQQFQVGADANQTIGVSVAGARATDLQNNTVALQGTNTTDLGGAIISTATGTAPANTIAAQTLTIAGSAGTAAVTVAVTSSAAAIATAVNANTASTGVKASATTSATLSGLTAGTISFALNGGGTATTISATVGAGGTVSGVAAAINAVSGKTGVTATANAAGTALTLTQAAGNDLTLTGFTSSGGGTATLDGANAAAAITLTPAAATDSARVLGTVSLFSDAGFTAVSSVAAGAGSVLGTTVTAATAANVSAVDISTIAGANTAVGIVDAALSQISKMRADMGAVQNRFTATIANLQTASENLSAARSRIRDADFAAETAIMTRNQILQQAGTAMLAQANALPNTVLTLLR
ncbi:MAG: flagellin [Nitrosomonadales bacterium]|nr:flagellin [Nitrosomonadales bacterium]